MKSPGKMLREAREERGLSVDDVATMTRIPKAMLGHLEHDRFEEYKADVFARGHLRNYARELRVDADQVLQAYEKYTGRQPKTLESSAGSSQASKENKKKRSVNAVVSSDGAALLSQLRATHVVAVVLTLVGIFMLWAYFSSNRATAQDPANFDQQESSSDWELEQDVEETRWLLEQSSGD